MAKSLQSTDKQRGTFLTVLIIILAVSVIFSLLSIPVIRISALVLGIHLPAWYPAYLVLLNVATVCALYGVWMLKKWGVYLLSATFILTLINTLVIFAFRQGTTELTLLIIDALWFWAVYRKWSVFSD